jgi:hypothetical protein
MCVCVCVCVLAYVRVCVTNASILDVLYLWQLSEETYFWSRSIHKQVPATTSDKMEAKTDGWQNMEWNSIRSRWRAAVPSTALKFWWLREARRCTVLQVLYETLLLLCWKVPTKWRFLPWRLCFWRKRYQSTLGVTDLRPLFPASSGGRNTYHPFDTHTHSTLHQVHFGNWHGGFNSPMTG